MASTRKEATMAGKRKAIVQNVVTITTNATVSETENDDDNQIQTINNSYGKHQRGRHNNEQVCCNNKTFHLSIMANHPSDKQRTIEMLNHNDAGNTRQNNLVIESVGVTDFHFSN